jgi:hypothetical protein
VGTAACLRSREGAGIGVLAGDPGGEAVLAHVNKTAQPYRIRRKRGQEPAGRGRCRRRGAATQPNFGPARSHRKILSEGAAIELHGTLCSPGAEAGSAGPPGAYFPLTGSKSLLRTIGFVLGSRGVHRGEKPSAGAGLLDIKGEIAHPAQWSVLAPKTTGALTVTLRPPG